MVTIKNLKTALADLLREPGHAAAASGAAPMRGLSNAEILLVAGGPECEVGLQPVQNAQI